MGKKLFTLLFATMMFFSSNAETLDEKYVDGYYLVAASINTAAKENNISLYRNNQIIILKPDPKGKNNKPVPFTATIKENGDIGKPKISKELMLLGISGQIAYDSINGKLYFAKYNALERNYALYEAFEEGGKWVNIKKMIIDGTGGQRAKANFMVSAGWSYKPIGLTGFKNPCVANNGKRIYFSANIKGNGLDRVGSSDIWYIDQKTDGVSWTFPKNIGRKANSPSKDDYPFCLNDTVLYFTSIGKGGYDLYKSVLVDSVWGKRESLPKPYNTSRKDQNMLSDGKYIFFVSDRKPMGKDDVFLFVEAPPKPEIPDPIPIPPQPEPDPEIVKKLTWNFVLFYFDFDTYVLSDEFTLQFSELVEEMKQFPGETFELAGHTDQKGSDKYNMKLSQKRAEFAKKLLIKEGFPAEKLIIKAFGESSPVIEDPQSDEEFAQNRRVEIRILPESIKNDNQENSSEAKETAEE